MEASHGCYKFNNADLALGPRDTTAHYPVFLRLRTTICPGPDHITRSEQAQQRRLERKATQHLNAATALVWEQTLGLAFKL